MNRHNFLAATVCTLALAVLAPYGVNAADEADVDNGQLWIQEEVMPEESQSGEEVEVEEADNGVVARDQMWRYTEPEETDIPELPESEYNSRFQDMHSELEQGSRPDIELRIKESGLSPAEQEQLRQTLLEPTGPAPEIPHEMEAQKPFVQQPIHSLPNH